MYITSEGIKDGVIELAYGKFGEAQFKGMPTYSLPFEIWNYPENTVAFSLLLIDFDAIPVIGFPFLHWSVANLRTPKLEANASATSASLLQGINSYASPLLNSGISLHEASCYGGMTPPDKTHTYYFSVYAQSEMLPIENGFFVNELLEKLKTSTIAIATIEGKYPASLASF